jgi:AraC family transcriptional activator of pobA
MTSLKTDIPIHDFTPEDDLGNLKMRYEPLNVRNDYDISEPHRHMYYELFFFKKGGGVHLIDFIEHPIVDNSIHLIAPGQVHLLRRDTKSYGAVIHFKKETATQLPQVYSLLQNAASPIFEHKDEAYRRILVVLQQLEEAIKSEDQNVDEMVACLWHILLKITSHQKAAKVKYESRSYKYFAELRLLVEENYRNNKLPVWYAAQLHITEKRLNEVCKEATGLTMSNYLKERIVLEAKRLLSHSAGSVKEVGYHLGFEDPSYFARFFKKNTGLTAGDFKEQSNGHTI